ncbi:MAG TPA: translocation/assembly module TamB domain-containing protein, partial [Gemmatimonadaceae bacterium]
MERLLRGGEPPPGVVVNAPQPVPGDTLTGVVNASGWISGNIYQFDLRGNANGEKVVARGNFVRRFKSEYAWENARTPNGKLAIAVDADSLSAMGFAFDSAMVRFSYEQPNRDGRIEVVAVQDRHREYSAKGDYKLTRDRGELELANMTFRFDTAFWSMPHSARVQWGPPGVRVTDFELRNRNSGRIYADGLLPAQGNADLQVEIDNFPIGNIVDAAQTDFEMSGVLMLRGTMTGTLSAPGFRGAFGVVNASYNTTEAPDVRGRFSYADRVLAAHVDALGKQGNIITKIDGRIPIDLAITGVTGDRLLPLPMVVDAEADSLPLELVPHFTDLVTNLHGHAAGKVALRGTLRRPSLVGGLVMERGSMTITATGANIDSVNASVRMANDTVYVDSVTARAKGTLRLRGTIAVGTWRDPTLNLFLVSDGAELLNNKYGKVRVNTGVSLTGPFSEPYISGDIAVTQGVVYAPEPEGRHVLGAGDPALFNVLDTTRAANRELFPPPSPFVSNLRVEVTVSVSHNTWVRNREANIEVYTDDPLFIRIEQQAVALTGVITTDRGEYNFLSKRFQIKRGTAIFIGGGEINPTLQITGEYQVQTASRGAINIRVQIGGTMRAIRLSLESDAQPPKTQSELLSLLA